MERKRLIRPITVLKVKNYLEEVYISVKRGEPFSLDKLAREHQISGSNGTALIRNNWLLENDVKGLYTISKDSFCFVGVYGIDGFANDTNAKKLIEQVRLLNDQSKNKVTYHSSGISYNSYGNGGTVDYKIKTEHEPVIQKKELKTSNFHKELLNVINGQKASQLNMFGDAQKEKDDLLKIVCSIASALYNSEVQTNDEVERINQMTIYAAKDLYQKFTSTSTK